MCLFWSARSPIVFSMLIICSHATEGSDYRKTSGTLSFAANETQKSLEVTIYDDGTPELDESIYVNLTSAVLTSGPTTGQT